MVAPSTQNLSGTGSSNKSNAIFKMRALCYKLLSRLKFDKSKAMDSIQLDHQSHLFAING